MDGGNGGMAPETVAEKIIQPVANCGYNLSTVKPTLNLDSAFISNCNITGVFEHGHLRDVTQLNLRKNKFTHLPNTFALNLNNVIELDLSDNDLKELPNNLNLLVNLQQLIADDNGLKFLPSCIGTLENLKSLIVRNNEITEIPNSFGELTNLEELNLSMNQIETVPDSCAKLGNMKTLVLSQNNIRNTPKCIIEGMPKLETLNLSRNYMLDLDTPPCSKALKRLYLTNEKTCKRFPNWILTEQFSNLEELVFDNTKFEDYSISNINSPVLHLKRLSMVGCGLSDTAFEKISFNMVDLEQLNVGNDITTNGGNLFWVMPVQNLKKAHALTYLNVQAAGLPAIPLEISTLTNLTILHVSHNCISWLPNEICDLDKLQVFRIGHNGLCMLPQDIGRMTALEELSLERNKLSDLPDSITDLRFLEYLDLYGNEFTEMPPTLRQIEMLNALDMDGNNCEIDNAQFGGTNYTDLRRAVRERCDARFLRSEGPNILAISEDPVDISSSSSSEYYSDYVPNMNYSDVDSVENWDVSEDSADEFDPTVPESPRIERKYSHFTMLSTPQYGNFCPADLHNTRARDQVAIMRERKQLAVSSIEDGQFEDA